MAHVKFADFSNKKIIKHVYHFEIIKIWTNSTELELFTTTKLFYKTTKLSHKATGYLYLKSNL